MLEEKPAAIGTGAGGELGHQGGAGRQLEAQPVPPQLQEQQEPGRFSSLPPIASIPCGGGESDGAGSDRSRLEEGEIETLRPHSQTPASAIVAAIATATTPAPTRFGTVSSNGLEEGEIRSNVDIDEGRAASIHTTSSGELQEREMSQDLASLSLEATGAMTTPALPWVEQQAEAAGQARPTTTAKKEQTKNTIRSPSRLPQVEVFITTSPPILRRSSTGTTASTRTFTTAAATNMTPSRLHRSVEPMTTPGDEDVDVDMNLDESDSEDSFDISIPTRKHQYKGKGKEVASQRRQSSPAGSVVSISSNDVFNKDNDNDTPVLNKHKGKGRQARMIRSPDIDTSDDEDDDDKPKEVDLAEEQIWQEFLKDSSDEDEGEDVGETAAQKKSHNDKNDTPRADKQRANNSHRQTTPRQRRPERAVGGHRPVTTASRITSNTNRGVVSKIGTQAGPSNVRRDSREFARPASSTSSTARSSGNNAQTEDSSRWEELVTNWKRRLIRSYRENRYEDGIPPPFGVSVGS
jgi:hypothetical protein